MSRITQTQIQDLYQFTRQHFVEHYDLQTELVDHLANDIEQILLDNPKLSFEEAKLKSFKKFGVFGFMNVIEQKQKAMNKRYMRYLWSELKTWFEIPQIVLTLCLFLGFYVAFSTSKASYFSFAFYGIVGTWSVYKAVKLNREFRRRKEVSNKKWLLEELIFKQASGTGLIFMSQLYNVFTVTDKFSSNTYAIVALAIAFTVLVLISYISFELIPNKAEKLLEEASPEYKIL